jgi:hypothetical protein
MGIRRDPTLPNPYQLQPLLVSTLSRYDTIKCLNGVDTGGIFIFETPDVSDYAT